MMFFWSGGNRVSKSWIVKLSIALSALIVIGLATAYIGYRAVKATLPQITNLKDYDPLVVSQVFDRNNKKVGEFFLERRTLIPFDKIPKNLINAFLAAEDDQFFSHGGINYMAILRALLANIRAGHTVQGGSTITQQVAKTFFLTEERKFLRKAQEAMLAFELERSLSKEDILYLYLNQIYFGNSAHGIENAALTYFQKTASELTLGEMAMLGGLPKAPSEYSPVKNPERAKERQAYVLKRMAEVGYITKEDAEREVKLPIKVYVRKNFEETAPYYLETVRQILVEKLGEDLVFKKGIQIYASLDVDKQKVAQDSLVRGLKELDKRQGFRGALRHLEDPKEIEDYFIKARRKIIAETTPERTINPDGHFAEIQLSKGTAEIAKTTNLPIFLKIDETYEGMVSQVDDLLGIIYVRLPDSKGVIDFDSMKWARKPNLEKRADLDQITKPSQAVTVGDIIHVKIAGEKPTFSKSVSAKKAVKNKPATPAVAGPDLSTFLHLELDQEPLVEGALISFDQESQDVLAIVGGYSFVRSKLIRAYQSFRQTGSAFKSIVYASALDKGYNPSTPIMDAPVVYEETKEDDEGQDDTKIWKPSNHGKSFGGEIIFRNALVRSLNIPTVKIMEDIGVNWAADYAKRLGVFSPLNMDFSLALGSSSLSLYEMTKVFSEFGRLGKKIRPIVIRKVLDRDGKVLLENVVLEERFAEKMKAIESEFEDRKKLLADAATAEASEEPAAAPKKIDPRKEKPDKYFFFQDPDQLIKPQTAYLITSLLKGVVEDRNGTGGRAKILGRDVAGKTGTTNGYADAWFVGYTAQIASGVWVGFDKEKSLGRGEVGGRAALPIWLEYMKSAHEGLREMTFPVPDGIVFANIDSETGKLPTASSKYVIRQAYAEGTEPTTTSNQSEEATDFLKRDLSD